MSANLMASSLLSSHAPVNREPQVPQSEARGQGSGFENLLAGFDPPNASASAARGDNGPASYTPRAASSADPGALGTSRATLTANIDAALSSLAKSASPAPAPTSPNAAPETTAARPAPSVDPGAPETSRLALPTEIDASLSSLAMVASRVQARAAPGPAATPAQAAPSADPSAPTTSRAPLVTDIDAASSSSTADASPAPAPTTPIVAAKPLAAPARAGHSLDASAPTTSDPALPIAIDASLSSPAASASRAPGRAAPIAAAKTVVMAARAAPSGAPSAAIPSRALLATQIGATPSSSPTDAYLAPEPAAAIVAAKTVAKAPRAAPSADPSAPTPSRAAPTANIDVAQSSLPMAAPLATGPAAPIPAAGTVATAAPSVAGGAAPVVASVKPSTTPARQTANTKDTPAPALARDATVDVAAVETTPNAAPAAEIVGIGAASAAAVVAAPVSSESETASPAIASWPTGSKFTRSLPDAGSWLSAAFTGSGAVTADVSEQPARASGGGGFQSEPASVTPGAAAGSILYATQIALSFAPELGFQGLKTKTHLAVPSAADAAGAGGRASAQAAAAASALFKPSVAPAAQADPRGERSPSPNSGSDDSTAAAPQTVAAKALEATPTILAAVSPSLVAPSGTPANAVKLSDLGDRLANEAQSLVNSDGKTSVGVAAFPIKELHLDLQPANLGAVAVRLKMTGGKLSVDVGVANPNALAAVESQRDTIISKLQAGTQPLESFVVHQQAFASPFSAQSSSNPSLTESSGNTSGHEHSSRDAREQTPRQPRTGPSDDPSPARNGLRTGLVV